MTSRAPTFLSDIMLIASKTVASGEIDQMFEPLCLRMAPTVPTSFILNALFITNPLFKANRKCFVFFAAPKLTACAAYCRLRSRFSVHDYCQREAGVTI